jgi:hypothetical protein
MVPHSTVIYVALPQGVSHNPARADGAAQRTKWAILWRRRRTGNVNHYRYAPVLPLIRQRRIIQARP